MPAHDPKPISIPYDGGAFTGWHWKNREQSSLLFCHATGFNAGAYRRMLAQLRDDFNIYAIDMRGHGLSRLPHTIHLHKGWSMYAADINAFLDIIGGSNWTVSGHSMGATACAIAAINRHDIAALRLIEPVVSPKVPFLMQKIFIDQIIARNLPIAKIAEKRRAEWSSIEEIRASYQRKKVFQNFAPGVLEDYLSDGLVKCDNKVTLSCSPAWEAETFRSSAKPAWDAFKNMGERGTVLYTDHHSSTVFKKSISTLNALGVRTFKAQGVSHLMALEDLELTANFIRKGFI